VVIDPRESAALVVLLRTGRRAWIAYADLVEKWGSAIAVLEEERAAQTGQGALFVEKADAHENRLLEGAAADVARWEEQGMRLVSVLHPDYPENLRAVHDRPPLIFVAGRLEPGDSRSVALVGARKASGQGAGRTRAIAEHLVDRGFTVGSGLAAGIDTAAHTAALARGGRTVAVIGTGLTRCYPPENAALQRRIAAECAVISQFWPDAPPTRRSFPMRNAVMSGLTLATVVVEASHTSGSRMQARLALAHGRPVFLAASLLEQQWARDYAQRPGTHVVDSPAQITAVIERMTSSDALVA
jgi:DNA processing protein